MDKPRSFAPFLATILLLLPLLYVVSYFALVRPAGISDESLQGGLYWADFYSVRYYAIIGNSGHRVYWPLEQIDRRVRPAAWSPWAWGFTSVPASKIQIYLCPSHPPEEKPEASEE
jgi:hypothetical protein